MATPLATPATTESSTLYFGPWYRRSPFFEKTLEAGCSAYDIYNHMYLPGYYADPVEEYWALLNDVTVWDVSVERIVEITGPDATAFTNSLTCRDLTKCAVGQGKYMLITAEDGGIVNDPVLLRVEEDRWWMALADSRRRPVGPRRGHPQRAGRQGPRAGGLPDPGPGPQVARHPAHALRRRPSTTSSTTGRSTTEVDGIPVVISRTGWTGEVGYEIYLRDPSRGGELWDRVMEAGKPHDIRPDRAVRGAPHRGRHLQLRLGHHHQRHALPRHGPGAARRGAGGRLHRQGRPRGDPPDRRRPQAHRHRDGRRRAARSRSRAS